MGSGTTGVACANLKRSFIGIERDDAYYQRASDRLYAAESATSLPGQVVLAGQAADLDRRSA